MAGHDYASFEELRRLTDTLIDRDHEIKVALHSVPIGIFSCDEEGKNLFVNNYYAEFVGCKPKELLGHGWQDFLSKEEAENAMKGWNKSLKASTFNYDVIIEFATRFGPRKAWAYSTPVLGSYASDDAGSKIKYVGVVVPLEHIIERFKEYERA